MRLADDVREYDVGGCSVWRYDIWSVREVGSKIVVSKIIVVSGPLAGWFSSFLLCASGAHEITEAPTTHPTLPKS